MNQSSATTTIAIIGGGFTGGAVAWNIARSPQGRPIRIIVFEPRDKLGAGLAYDTSDPVHRINVPADRMALDPDASEDFITWFNENDGPQRDPGSRTADGRIFPRRSDFGAYVGARIAPYLADDRIEHVRSEVVNVERLSSGWRLIAGNGAVTDVDFVIIATSHPAPSAPRVLASVLEGHPRFIGDATAPQALAAIRPMDSVLIVGNGLTGADVAASLLESGHKGQITSISRRGLRSRGHSLTPEEPHGDFVSRPIHSARLLTRRVREAIDQAALFNVSWRAAIDAVRGQGQTVWSNLPLAERRRLVRHLRPFWDVHRFRIAPQVEAAIDAAIERGQMESLAASVGAVTYHGTKIRTGLRLARKKGTLVRDFDAVVVTTGPAHGGIIESQDYLQGLAREGLVALDPTGLGLSCDLSSRILDRNSKVVPDMLVAGPLARAAFGELMGLPQVSAHAKSIAQTVLARFGSASATRTNSAA